MELHLQVKAARKQAGLSQEQLAQTAQVGRRDISRFERGENVTMKTFLRIVGALPNLTELKIGSLNMTKDGAAPEAGGGDVLRRQAMAILQNLSDSNPLPPETPPRAEGGSQRELSLMRTLLKLLLEITGGENAP